MELFLAAWIVVITAVVVALLPRYLRGSPPAVWSGYTAPGWEKVRQVYKDQIESGVDLGSTFAVYHQGELVVHLVGGYSDRETNRPWTNSTTTNSFSVTKGVSAVVAALLVERGDLDYKERVSKYWLEFAQNGKEDITVEMVLNHQAGLVTLDEDLYSSDIRGNPEKVSRILAQQKPDWVPGTKHGYHMTTFGLYVNEIVKRADPQRRPLWEIFQQDIAEEFDIDFTIGLDPREFHRLARIVPPSLFKDWESFTATHMWRMILNMAMNAETRRLFLGAFSALKDKRFGGLDSPEFLEAPICTSNGIGTAEAVAKLYGTLTAGMRYTGRRILSRETVELLTEALVTGPDAVVGSDTSYTRGMNIQRSCVGSTMFGTPGIGGQMGFGDLEHNLGFCYLTNNLCQFSQGDNPRALNLLKAVYDCVLEIEQKLK